MCYFNVSEDVGCLPGLQGLAHWLPWIQFSILDRLTMTFLHSSFAVGFWDPGGGGGAGS